jgi:hypothetical protein
LSSRADQFPRAEKRGLRVYFLIVLAIFVLLVARLLIVQFETSDFTWERVKRKLGTVRSQLFSSDAAAQREVERA